MKRNPYVSRGPVRIPGMFFGREHETNEIIAFLQGNQSISIVGPRKIGKTSLLFHIMRPECWLKKGLQDHFLFAYLDCEVLGEGTHEEIFGLFAHEIAVSLIDRELPPEPLLEKAIEKPNRLSFERAIRTLNQRGFRVVLILDEFERLSTNPNLTVNFFNALRSAAGRYQLIFLTASARPLIKLTYADDSQEILSSPFFNIFAQQFLGLLPETEARSLIQEPALESGITFSAEIEDFLYKLVGGHPFALQVACFYAFDNDDKDEIEQKTLRELDAHFEYYWRNLTPIEKTTLTFLTTKLEQLHQDTTISGVLRELAHKCLLVPENGTYRYASRAWRQYVEKYKGENSSPASFREQLLGQKIGAYEIHEIIGRGGMAEVFKGVHKRLNRPVALKVLPLHLARQGDFQARFVREAQAVAALRHTNIVQVHDFGDVDGLYYMVMEYIDGQDLTGYLRDRGRLSLAEARPLVMDIASALDYAHQKGLVHRDVKPSNILLRPVTTTENDRTYHAILTDFGIAKILGSHTLSTKTSSMMGSLDFVSPEQIQGATNVKKYADIYSLGALLYMIVTGQTPFPRGNPGAILMAHLHDPPPNPCDLVPDLPSHIADVIAKAMAKEPYKRFNSAGELTSLI